MKAESSFGSWWGESLREKLGVVKRPTSLVHDIVEAAIAFLGKLAAYLMQISSILPLQSLSNPSHTSGEGMQLASGQPNTMDTF